MRRHATWDLPTRRNSVLRFVSEIGDFFLKRKIRCCVRDLLATRVATEVLPGSFWDSPAPRSTAVPPSLEAMADKPTFCKRAGCSFYQFNRGSGLNPDTTANRRRDTGIGPVVGHRCAHRCQKNTVGTGHFPIHNDITIPHSPACRQATREMLDGAVVRWSDH